MKTLSIKQPWAHAIVHWGKNIENRTWNTKFRGRFRVHAGMSVDKVALEAFRAAGYPVPEEFQLGGIVGEVDLVDVVQDSTSPWFEGPHGFVLENAKPVEFIPMRGQLGFFES